jgi:hypothetical protein
MVKSNTMRLIAYILTALVLIATVLKEAQALEGEKTIERYRGIHLMNVPVEAGARYDISIVGRKEGIAKIKKAIDLVLDKSSLSRSAIASLKKAGNVVIVYDPNFPDEKLNELRIATFLSEFYQHDGPKKDFLSVVGRYGVKWPLRELSGVLVHELVGHGIQHLRKRLTYVREIDLECEAYLYQEDAHQILKMDKKSNDMVIFRQSLENHWCADFKSYMAQNAPEEMKLWDALNPDVHKLLKFFQAYVDKLKYDGVAARAIDAAKELRANGAAKKRQR